MQLLFININPPLLEGDTLYPPLGIYQLAAAARQAHIECDILDMAAFKKENYNEMINRTGKFDCLYLHADTRGWPHVKEAVSRIRNGVGEITVILGGLFPTLFDAHVLEVSNVDFCIRGEPENTLVQLIGWLRKRKGEPAKIPGITYRKKGEIIRTKPSSLLVERELEHLPFPLYQLMPPGIYQAPSIESSRGKPFYTPLDIIPEHKEWRGISPRGIFERVWKAGEFLEKTGGKYINLADSYFTAKAKRVFDLTELIEKNKKRYPWVKIAYDTRLADLVDESLVVKLAPITAQIRLHPLMGYNRGLGNFHSGFNLKVIEDTAKILEKYGMNGIAQYSFMTGFPGETPEEAEKTLKFAENLRDKYGVSIRTTEFQIRPGSLYFKKMMEEGKIDISMYDGAGEF